MKSLVRVLAALALVALLPSLGRTQGVTDYSEMQQWVKDSEHQGNIPIGTKITMANWQQYKQFMPIGMIKLFEGVYHWKLPPDVEMNVGPPHYGTRLKSFQDATEKYSSQVRVAKLPNGHYQLLNFHGGVPFPNPQEPYKGWKVLANIFFAYYPSVVAVTPRNNGTVWAVDRYADVSPSTYLAVYRWSDYNTDPGFPVKFDYAPGTWYTEFAEQVLPEQSRYTSAVNLYYEDQEAHPYPDLYVFVPALRRSLRLSTTARCSPYLGTDWSYDDGKGNGFNGSTSIFDGDFLGDREVLTLTKFNTKDADYPGEYYMNVGFPKPSWGDWEVRHMAVVDIHRIPSESAGYCYRHRVMYVEKELWNGDWADMYDSNNKLWKSISYYNSVGNVPGLGYTVNGGIASAAMDFQNAHETIWCGNVNKEGYILPEDYNVPKEYLDGIKYGSPAGLMQIMR